tara:strand:+ start:181 stop:876 length:696 start_codon:yes stop_codon:yes gene_type:complete
MKLAILGDIHGNHLALKAVLNSASNEGVDKLLITGDLVGYYPFVREVLELLQDWNHIAVAGNHEVMFKRAISDVTFLEMITKKYGSSIKIALETLSQEQINFLATMPIIMEFEISNRAIILCHGSPVDVDEYIYPDSDLSKLTWLDSHSSQIILCGHTHYPMLREMNSTTILNPGSVGQPRNGVRKAHWVLFDTTKNTFEFMLEEYDINSIIESVRVTDPTNLYLQKVLTR